MVCQEAVNYPFLQSLHLPTVLAGYPDTWTAREKGSYLLNVVSGEHLPWHAVRSRINSYSQIDWPRNDDGWPRDDARSVIQPLQMVLLLQGKWKKDPAYRFDYIHQCRNGHKHFGELPIQIKVK